MADVTKIKLPDNSTVNIKDYRIPGVDTTPTSGSDNLVTSGGVYKDINDAAEVTSAALNDLNDRLAAVETFTDAIEVDDYPQENSEKLVTSGGVYDAIVETEFATATALNTLNDRLTEIAEDYNSTQYATSSALNDLNNRISDIEDTEFLTSSDLSSITNELSNTYVPISSYEVDEEVFTRSLNDLNSRLNNVYNKSQVDTLIQNVDVGEVVSQINIGQTEYTPTDGVVSLPKEVFVIDITYDSVNDSYSTTSTTTEIEAAITANKDIIFNIDYGDEYSCIYDVNAIYVDEATENNETVYTRVLEASIGQITSSNPASYNIVSTKLQYTIGESSITISENASPSLATVSDLSAKQDVLTSGTNIKTINNTSLLGSGNITITGDGVIGNLITDNTTAQTPSASESFTGDINLHKIAKTGTYSDLIDAPVVGNAKIFYGTCSTAAATTTKVVTCPSFTAEDLVKGAIIFVTFTTTNSGAVASLKLDVNSTGAKTMQKLRNAAEANLSAVGELVANVTYIFVYDGSKWVLITSDYNTNTTYNSMPASTANAGTNTTAYLITAAVLKGAILTQMKNNQANWNVTDTTAADYIENKPIDIIKFDDTFYTAWIGESLLELTEGTYAKIAADLTAGVVPTLVLYSAADSCFVEFLFLEDDRANDNVKFGTLINSSGVVKTITINNDDSVTCSSFTIQSSGNNGGNNSGSGSGSGSGGGITTETDPVFTASAAYGITSSDITNWNSKTSNTGTLTGVSFNGVDATVTSGVAAITATIPSAPGTLDTTATTAQSTNASETLSGSITLHKVAKTGTYSDLIGIPTIPTKVSDLTNDSGFTTNAGTITGITMNGASKGTSGVIDLGTVITSHQDITGKQDALVSGTNIKTINNESILGSGNITTSGATVTFRVW